MIPEPVFRAIEHPTFSASVGVVSTTHRLEAVLPRIAEVVELLRHVSVHEDVGELLLRAERLLLVEVPPDGPHPHDIPLAVYLWSLDLLSEQLARRLAERMMGIRGLWWPQALASRILATPTLASDGAVSYESHVLHAEPPPTIQVTATNSLNAALLSSRGPRLLSMTVSQETFDTDAQPQDFSAGWPATEDLRVRVTAL
jgi:hypothetical protein